MANSISRDRLNTALGSNRGAVPVTRKSRRSPGAADGDADSKRGLIDQLLGLVLGAAGTIFAAFLIWQALSRGTVS